MEMHFADRRTVNLGFGLTQSREDGLGQFLLPVRENAAVNHLRDVVQVPMRVLRLVVDMDFRGAEPVFLHFLGPQLAAGQAQRVDPGLQGGQFHASVDQRAQRHVAADAAETVEVCDVHGFLSSRLKGRSVA